MKLLIDQNISYRIIPLIATLFPDAKHVKSADLIDKSDLEIFNYARKNNFDTIVTLDEDFQNIQSVHGIPPKIIWLRTGNCTTKFLAQTITKHHKLIQDFLMDVSLDSLELFQ